MRKFAKIAIIGLLAAAVITLAVSYLHGANIAVLNPKGIIAQKERNLIVLATLLMAVVVAPVLALTFGIAWRYRAGNTKATYTPDWDHNRIAETIWWLVPSALIFILSVVTWNSSHELDPFKPLASATPAITVEVVALDWKWLFMYPQQHIATVNLVEFPQNTPVNFIITSDAPMNSFWIPQLGGQIYAMPGMSTQLHLMAGGLGSYAGSSANISGVGFAGMRFTAKSTTRADFNAWVVAAQKSPRQLSQSAYNALLKPSQNNPVAYYSTPDPRLYDTIVLKYMTPNSLQSAAETP